MRLALVAALALVVACARADKRPKALFTGWSLHLHDGATASILDIQTIVAIHGVVSTKMLGRDVLGDYARTEYALHFYGRELSPGVTGQSLTKEALVSDIKECLADGSLSHELTHLDERTAKGWSDERHIDPLYWGPTGIAEESQDLARQVLCGRR